MKAKAIENTLNVLSCVTLPDGDKCLTVPAYLGWDSVKNLPAALEFDGRTYGYTGWNSDRNVAYYKTSKGFATMKKN